MKKRPFIRMALGAIFILTIVLSCNLLPVEEAVYQFFASGKSFAGDDFEINNGTFSISHPWNRSSDFKPEIQQDVVYSGDWAVQFGGVGYNDTSSFRLDVDFPKSRIITFMLKDDTVPVYFSFYDGDMEPYNTYKFVDEWKLNTYNLTAGAKELKWEIRGQRSYSSAPKIYLDDIRVYQNIKPYDFLGYIYNIGEDVVLSWEAGNDYSASSTFRVQVAEDKDFKNIVEEGSVSGKNIYTVSTQLIGSKSYFWRVQASLADGSPDNVWGIPGTVGVISSPVDDDFEINDTLFSTQNIYRRGGDALPFVQQSTRYSGQWAVQFGNISSNQESWFELTCLLTVPMNLYFWYMVDCNDYGNQLEVYVNDIKQLSIASNKLWFRTFVYLSPGFTSIKWRFKKSYSYSSGVNMAWVDAISFYPY